MAVSGIRHKLGGGLVLTGGGSAMKDITQLFNYHIGLEVHIGSPGQHLGKGMIDEVRNPMFATGIGLVLKGFDLAIKHGMGIGNTVIQKEEVKEPVQQPFFEDVVALAPEEKETKQGKTPFTGGWGIKLS